MERGFDIARPLFFSFFFFLPAVLLIITPAGAVRSATGKQTSLTGKIGVRGKRCERGCMPAGAGAGDDWKKQGKEDRTWLKGERFLQGMSDRPDDGVGERLSKPPDDIRFARRWLLVGRALCAN